MIAHEMEVLKLGAVSLDGTKVKANASIHKALSDEHANKLETQIKADVAELLKKADAADHADIPDGMSIPEELERRTDRLAAIAAVKVEIERRAAERYVNEQAAYEKNVARRDKQERETGKKPKPPIAGPTAKDQVNLNDSESRICQHLVEASSRHTTPRPGLTRKQC